MLLTVIEKVSVLDIAPEYIPAPKMGAQGLSKLDRATEWPGWITNSTTSPSPAVMVSGVKTKPFLPTWTVCTFEEPPAAVVAAGAAADAELDEEPLLPY